MYRWNGLGSGAGVGFTGSHVGLRVGNNLGYALALNLGLRASSPQHAFGEHSTQMWQLERYREVGPPCGQRMGGSQCVQFASHSAYA